MPESSAETRNLASELHTAVTRLVKQLRAHSPTREQLSLTERAVVLLLEQHPYLLPTELAAREKVTTQAMSQILSRLAARGLVARHPAPDDGRKTHVRITEAGRQLLQAARHERDEWLQQALQVQCSAQELQALRAALPVLAKIIDSE